MPGWMQVPVAEEREDYEGWHHYNVHAMQDLAAFAAWWAEMCLPEPHSTVGVDFATARALGTTPESLAKTLYPAGQPGFETMEDCPASGGPAVRRDGTSDPLPRGCPQRDPGRGHAARLG